MCPGQFKRLVLVGAMGIRPPSGQIHDMFLEVAKQYLATSYFNAANTPEFQKICPDTPTPELWLRDLWREGEPICWVTTSEDPSNGAPKQVRGL
jgi:hypothetical protein